MQAYFDSMLNSFISGEGTIGYLMLLVYIVAVAVFGVMVVSCIYHWNYYGVGKVLRFSLLTAFSFVGAVLLLVAGILLMRFL